MAIYDLLEHEQTVIAEHRKKTPETFNRSAVLYQQRRVDIMGLRPVLAIPLGTLYSPAARQMKPRANLPGTLQPSRMSRVAAGLVSCTITRLRYILRDHGWSSRCQPESPVFRLPGAPEAAQELRSMLTLRIYPC